MTAQRVESVPPLAGRVRAAQLPVWTRGVRHLACVVICSAVVQLLAPTPVYAWFGDIDKWSGPGPFLFVDWQGRLACINDPDHSTPKLRSVDSFPEHKVWAAIAGAGCLTDWKKHPIASLNLRVAYWWSRDNGLHYANNAPGPTVRVWQFEPSFSVFVDANKFVELSSGAGVLAIRVNGNTITRAYLKPVEVTMTPGAVLAPTTGARRVARSFGIRFGVMLMPEGFDATDFGAIPGTFHTDREVQATVAVTFDPSRLR